MTGDTVKSKEVALIIAFAAVSVCAQSGNILVLDLVKNRPQTHRFFEPTAISSTGMLASGGNATPIPPGLELRLLRVHIGKRGDVVYEVKLTNLQRKAVCVPTDPNIRDVEPALPQTYSYEGIDIFLTAIDTTGNAKALSGVSLFADRTRAKCHPLLEQESVVIRAKTELISRSVEDRGFGDNFKLTATWTPFTAQVTFSGGRIQENSTNLPPVVSQNALLCPAECGEE
jgi:hypothetical protein